MSQLRPPFAYLGSKQRLALWCEAMLPSHRIYLEPFAGSAAVLLAKQPSAIEILNDIDGELIRFFRLLRDHPADLIRACELTPYAREELHLAKAAPSEHTDEVELARRWWVRSVQSVSGAGHGWSVTLNRSASRAATAVSMVERMRAVAMRLRNVQIECRPALEVLDSLASPGAVVYCDPPYLGSTRRAGAETAGRDYRHDMAGEDQHRQLAKALNACQAAVLISGYPSSLYDELYEGWWRAERPTLKMTANVSGGGLTPATEVVWSNRPLCVQGRLEEVS